MELTLKCPDIVLFRSNMEWAKPAFKRGEVNAAGRILVAGSGDPGFEHALTVINNWRASHAFPLNTFQVGLRERARQVQAGTIVAQRVKRISSIELKLRNLPTLRLTQMQDIGGCRAVLKTVGDVDQLVAAYRDSRIKHKLVNEDDYIAAPRDSGYRSHHLVYRYYSDRSPTYEDLKIEMQIRTTLQHAWATAVEVVGMFTDQALKSAMGDDRWLRFFALMGSAIAIREKTPTVPGTPSTRKGLAIELRELANELDVQNRLRSYQTTLNAIRTNPSLSGGHFFLLSLDTRANSLRITIYRKGQLDKASADYLELERENRSLAGTDAVLVSADGVSALNRAYPNYFADTTTFLQEVRRAIV